MIPHVPTAAHFPLPEPRKMRCKSMRDEDGTFIVERQCRACGLTVTIALSNIPRCLVAADMQACMRFLDEHECGDCNANQ